MNRKPKTTVSTVSRTPRAPQISRNSLFCASALTHHFLQSTDLRHCVQLAIALGGALGQGVQFPVALNGALGQGVQTSGHR